MDAACSAGGYGYPLSTTEDFCYFSSLKSKTSQRNAIKNHNANLRYASSLKNKHKKADLSCLRSALL